MVSTPNRFAVLSSDDDEPHPQVIDGGPPPPPPTNDGSDTGSTYEPLPALIRITSTYGVCGTNVKKHVVTEEPIERILTPSTMVMRNTDPCTENLASTAIETIKNLSMDAIMDDETIDPSTFVATFEKFQEHSDKELFKFTCSYDDHGTRKTISGRPTATKLAEMFTATVTSYAGNPDLFEVFELELTYRLHITPVPPAVDYCMRQRRYA